MRRSLLLTTFASIGILGLSLAACSDDATAPPKQQQTVPGTPDPEIPGSSSGDPAPTPTTTPPVDPGPPPEPPFVWVAPVVPTTSAACGTPMNDAVGVHYTTPTGRKFHVWGPSNYQPGQTYPVVLMFHGQQTTGDGFQSWFKMEQHTQNEAFVVYLDAVAGYWNLQGDSDLLFVDEVIKQLGETYCINPSRVLGFGFSYGGFFASHLGCKRAGYVKAIMVGDGNWGGDGQKCGRLPVLVTTRTHDEDEPVSHGKYVQAQWIGLNKCAAAADPADSLNCVVQQGCNNPGTVTYCEDTWFEPTWPKDWNHTVRGPYRDFAYSWFKALP